MNVVDSSGWLEFFAEGPNAANFEPPLRKVDVLVVPTITIYEVFKVLLRESEENNALKAVAAMQQGQVIELDCSISISASRLSLKYDLPMADSIILATARLYDCVVWTQNSDFEGLANVNFFPKCS